jgi:hypothetical protein
MLDTFARMLSPEAACGQVENEGKSVLSSAELTLRPWGYMAIVRVVPVRTEKAKWIHAALATSVRLAVPPRSFLLGQHHCINFMNHTVVCLDIALGDIRFLVQRDLAVV